MAACTAALGQTNAVSAYIFQASGRLLAVGIGRGPDGPMTVDGSRAQDSSASYDPQRTESGIQNRKSMASFGKSFEEWIRERQCRELIRPARIREFVICLPVLFLYFLEIF